MSNVAVCEGLAESKPDALGVPVRIRGLSQAFGQVRAVDDISFDIGAGEFVSLLGPSGSGKTTVLMAIAGFQQPTAGDILLEGRNVVPLPANKRNIGMVFQKYALFPHMTVARNIAFPLEMRGWDKSRIAEAVEDILRVVDLSKLANRKPAQLSGGQQQRVALARSIVFEPPLLLMDEPLSALDKKLREGMQIEIKRLQRQLGATVLFVTHDQSEALAMSDRIVVMSNGRIEQIGTPQEIYENPASLFVADFIGNSNLFEGHLVEGEESSDVGAIHVAGAHLKGRRRRSKPGKSQAVGTLMVRPESVTISAWNHSSPRTALRGIVREIVFEGAASTFLLQCGDIEIRAAMPVSTDRRHAAVGIGDAAAITWKHDDAIIFDEVKR